MDNKWEEVYLGGSPTAEAEIVKKLAYEIKEVQTKLKKREKASVLRRAFHAKIHVGVTNAKFKILNIPENLQVGFFQPGKEYPAIIRFSNASGTIQSDSKDDMRGVAFRVDALGNTHDFLFTNAPASHARDAQQFMVTAKALASKSRFIVFIKLIFGLGLFEAFRMIRTLKKGASRKIDSMANESFWSRAPYSFGAEAVKFVLQPQEIKKQTTLSGDNYLREDLIRRLKEEDIVFDFKLQKYVNDMKTPIEDGVVEWREEDSPFIKVAELIIPKQELNIGSTNPIEETVNGLKFNPWNTTEDFRPLGSLNRARKLVYNASANYREDKESYTPRGVISSIFWRFYEFSFMCLNKIIPWHKLPTKLGILNLIALRRELREHNLHDTSIPEIIPETTPKIEKVEPKSLCTRLSNGTYNDLGSPKMGKAGSRFGRNLPLEYTHPDINNLFKPDPRTISLELLTRDTFKPAKTLNLLAVAWIQFQVHEWFNHEKKKNEYLEIPLDENDERNNFFKESPEKPPCMRVAKTLPDKLESSNSEAPPAYASTETFWWDGSQIYGSDPSLTAIIRSHENGKLKIEGGLLPFDPETGIEITGFNNNWWLGLSLMHTLFSLEHNAICDALRVQYRSWDDEQIFQVARLINAALMAKIHTVEWTPAILGHPALQIAMDANWWGLVGEKLTNLFGRVSNSEVISGIMGSATDHHTAPYSLTEEFSAVYRMHPLMPDDFYFFSLESNKVLAKKTLVQVSGKETRKILNDIPIKDLFYSFGLAHPGAITLHNYPYYLQNLETLKDGKMDLAAVDVLRDRERGIPRYNQFRQLLHLPKIKSFKQMTNNPEWAKQLEKVYGDVDKVDAMVGMFAETPPKGFGFSDTAFRVFIVMASRRLKSDRFFTKDFTPDIYTQVGLDWIEKNDMKAVLLRHYPNLTPAVQNIKNAFAPWQQT